MGVKKFLAASALALVMGASGVLPASAQLVLKNSYSDSLSTDGELDRRIEAALAVMNDPNSPAFNATPEQKLGALIPVLGYSLEREIRQGGGGEQIDFNDMFVWLLDRLSVIAYDHFDIPDLLKHPELADIFQGLPEMISVPGESGMAWSGFKFNEPYMSAILEGALAADGLQGEDGPDGGRTLHFQGLSSSNSLDQRREALLRQNNLIYSDLAFRNSYYVELLNSAQNTVQNGTDPRVPYDRPLPSVITNEEESQAHFANLLRFLPQSGLSLGDQFSLIKAHVAMYMPDLPEAERGAWIDRQLAYAANQLNVDLDEALAAPASQIQVEMPPQGAHAVSIVNTGGDFGNRDRLIMTGLSRPLTMSVPQIENVDGRSTLTMDFSGPYYPARFRENSALVNSHIEGRARAGQTDAAQAENAPEQDDLLTVWKYNEETGLWEESPEVTRQQFNNAELSEQSDLASDPFGAQGAAAQAADDAQRAAEQSAREAAEEAARSAQESAAEAANDAADVVDDVFDDF